MAEIALTPVQAKELVEIAREVVQETVASVYSCDDPSVSCSCFVCRAIRVLVEVDGPGRCVICGCDDDHACAPDGCDWADESMMLCDRHPEEDLRVARSVLNAWIRGRRG